MLGHDVLTASRKPEEWCEILGLQILDIDGWRHVIDDDILPKSYEDEIYLHEFMRRYVACTVNPVQKIVKETVRIEKPVTLEVYMEGSGDPEKHHDIIGIQVVEDNGASTGIGRIPDPENVKEV